MMSKIKDVHNKYVQLRQKAEGKVRGKGLQVVWDDANECRAETV